MPLGSLLSQENDSLVPSPKVVEFHGEWVRSSGQVGGSWLRQCCHFIPVVAKQLATHGGQWPMGCSWKHIPSVVCNPTPSTCS